MEKNKSFSADDEFDDEESKMKKFYDLIRRFNKARAHHQRNQVETKLPRINRNHNINSSGHDNRKEDVMKSESGSAALMVPSFKWEDFSDVYGHHHLQDEDQFVVSGKSGINFTKSGNNIVDMYGKKRKIEEIEVVDDDYVYDEITFADQLKNSSPQYETGSGLDLNLAL